MKSLLATLALVGATVHTGDGKTIEHATVVIEGERVVAVGAQVTPPRDAIRVDVTGKRITPGLAAVTPRPGTQRP